MKKENQLERLTILVRHDEINRIKHIAVDRGISTSEIVRSAVGDFLKAETSDQTEAPKSR